MQPEILLTLSAGSVAPLIAEKDPRCPTVFQVPQFVATDLQLRGLNLPASLLAGFGLPDIDRLRDEADRAHCPVLLLSEETPIDFTDRGEVFAKARDRLKRLALAANRLGCPSIAVRAAAADSEQAFEATVQGVKVALREIDRYELNLLLSPDEGLTFDPTRLTDLIKKIGGFRIGSYPSFAHAAATGDVEKALRKLAPYAPAICASIRGFAKDGTHEGYSLEACVESVRSVGYGNTLALDFSNRDGETEVEGKKPRKGARKPSISDIIEVLDRGRQVLEAATSLPELEEELVEEEE
ncbi:MAG: sugar phosphate isomerase/epimerase [Planctomycetaceae bacterium]|nr:sugar phosphate isomerase/epimerase [Planctomycetaceae bacterium]